MLAASLVYLVRLVLPGDYYGAPALLIFVPLYLAVFAALLIALGLSQSDRQFLASFWSAVRRNVQRTTPKGA